MNMNNFILNRPDDVLTLLTKKIVGTTLKWLLILLGGAILLRIICVSVYMSMGIDPTQLTKFGGDPTSFKGQAFWKTYLTLLLYAPLMEELMFRLGLCDTVCNSAEHFVRCFNNFALVILPQIAVCENVKGERGQFCMRHCCSFYHHRAA